LIVGQNEMVIVPLETKIEDPVAIEVFDIDAVNSFRKYFRDELWVNSRTVESDDFGKLITKLTTSRKRQMKVAVGNYIKDEIVRGEEFLEIPSLDKAKIALGIQLFDECIYREALEEAKKLIAKLESIPEQSHRLEEISSWLEGND